MSQSPDPSGSPAASSPSAEELLEPQVAFAGCAAVALANHSLYAAALQANAQLANAMESRAVIEQARGVLIGSLHCSPDEAFTHLARQSQNTNRKLRDIATETVERAARG